MVEIDGNWIGVGGKLNVSITVGMIGVLVSKGVGVGDFTGIFEIVGETREPIIEGVIENVPVFIGSVEIGSTVELHPNTTKTVTKQIINVIAFIVIYLFSRVEPFGHFRGHKFSPSI